LGTERRIGGVSLHDLSTGRRTARGPLGDPHAFAGEQQKLRQRVAHLARPK
jgi:hypothetical protein